MAKAAFNKKRTLFTGTLDLELRKELVKCYVWSIASYGAETWTLRAMDIYIYIYDISRRRIKASLSGP